jgi:hypothetical protein
MSADASAAAASKTSFAAFGNLLLGALFAAIGGSLAVQRRLQGYLYDADLRKRDYGQSNGDGDRNRVHARSAVDT